MKRNILFSLVVAMLFAVFPDVADACPNCKESYMQEGQSPVASGFNTSILFMMAMPFFVIGIFVLRLWMARRDTRTQ